MDKLSELSKPVCTDERPCINCFSGNGPCTVENSTTADMKDPVAYSWVGFPNRKQLSRCEPERWKQPRNIVPLYSQEYVSALLAELEAKDKRIADMTTKRDLWFGKVKDLEAKLANREAKPVWIDAEVHEAIQDILQGRMSGAGRYVTLNRNQAPNGFKQRMPIYTAPPAPVVNPEFTGATAVPEKPRLAPHVYRDLLDMLQEAAIAYSGTQQLRAQLSSALSIHVQPDHQHTRAAMLAQPVSQGCKLPDNVREALTLALQAMEFMGDTLNNIDAVCTEDVEYVTPAFTAVRGLLEAAPEVTVPTTKINCWSCKKSMTTLQLMSSDGICPHCNAEIDTEDDDE